VYVGTHPLIYYVLTMHPLCAHACTSCLAIVYATVEALSFDAVHVAQILSMHYASFTPFGLPYIN
jgi:hypothetical protein